MSYQLSFPKYKIVIPIIFMTEKNMFSSSVPQDDTYVMPFITRIKRNNVINGFLFINNVQQKCHLVFRHIVAERRNSITRFNLKGSFYYTPYTRVINKKTRYQLLDFD